MGFTRVPEYSSSNYFECGIRFSPSKFIFRQPQNSAFGCVVPVYSSSYSLQAFFKVGWLDHTSRRQITVNVPNPLEIVVDRPAINLIDNHFDRIFNVSADNQKAVAYRYDLWTCESARLELNSAIRRIAFLHGTRLERQKSECIQAIYHV